MWWILIVLAQSSVIALGVRREWRTGLWSASKFAFALGFALLEVLLLVLPLRYIPLQSRWFVPALCVAGALAALNFIWMIYVARHWKLPDGRTSLQAFRERPPE